VNPLERAICKQADEMVDLLLSHGANPNRDRCSIAAVGADLPGERQLRYLRLLVEHGLNVNQRFDWFGNQDALFTVLDRVFLPEVHEYIRSVGGLTAAELATGTKATERLEAIRKSPEQELREVVVWFEQNFGKVTQSLTATLDIAKEYAVHVISSATKDQPVTLFTTGLSRKPMKVPSQAGSGLAELYIQLPPDWDLSVPDQQWPVDLLFELVSYPHRHGEAYLSPLTCIGSGHPPAPIRPELPFTSTALICIQRFTRSDGKDVQLFFILPIYAEEEEMIRTTGVPAFLQSLDKHRIDQTFQPNRPNVATTGG
jgi:hypothetical protein